MGMPDYEDLELRGELFNQKNLKRIIRVRNILKNRVDYENDHLNIENPNFLRDQNFEIDEKISKASLRSKPPSFLKSNFKGRTMHRWKCVNGQYFGCIV